MHVLSETAFYSKPFASLELSKSDWQIHWAGIKRSWTKDCHNGATLLVCPPQQRKVWLQPAVPEAEGCWVGLPTPILSLNPNVNPNLQIPSVRWARYEDTWSSATLTAKSESEERFTSAFGGSNYCIEIGTAITALLTEKFELSQRGRILQHAIKTIYCILLF